MRARQRPRDPRSAGRAAPSAGGGRRRRARHCPPRQPRQRDRNRAARSGPARLASPRRDQRPRLREKEGGREEPAPAAAALPARGGGAALRSRSPPPPPAAAADAHPRGRCRPLPVPALTAPAAAPPPLGAGTEGGKEEGRGQLYPISRAGPTRSLCIPRQAERTRENGDGYGAKRPPAHRQSPAAQPSPAPSPPLCPAPGVSRAPSAPLPPRSRRYLPPARPRRPHAPEVPGRGRQPSPGENPAGPAPRPIRAPPAPAPRPVRPALAPPPRSLRRHWLVQPSISAGNSCPRPLFLDGFQRPLPGGRAGAAGGRDGSGASLQPGHRTADTPSGRAAGEPRSRAGSGRAPAARGAVPLSRGAAGRNEGGTAASRAARTRRGRGDPSRLSAALGRCHLQPVGTDTPPGARRDPPGGRAGATLPFREVQGRDSIGSALVGTWSGKGSQGLQCPAEGQRGCGEMRASGWV